MFIEAKLNLRKWRSSNIEFHKYMQGKYEICSDSNNDTYSLLKLNPIYLFIVFESKNQRKILEPGEKF